MLFESLIILQEQIVIVICLYSDYFLPICLLIFTELNWTKEKITELKTLQYSSTWKKGVYISKWCFKATIILNPFAIATITMMSISLSKHHSILPTFFHMIDYLSSGSYYVVQQKRFSSIVNKYTILGGVCPNDPFFSISTNVFYLLFL